jgi:hypothetical protein
MVAAETSLTAANDLAIRRAFEAAGVEFIDENGGGPGVTVAKATTKEQLGRCRFSSERFGAGHHKARPRPKWPILAKRTQNIFNISVSRALD